MGVFVGVSVFMRVFRFVGVGVYVCFVVGM